MDQKNNVTEDIVVEEQVQILKNAPMAQYRDLQAEFKKSANTFSDLNVVIIKKPMDYNKVMTQLNALQESVDKMIRIMEEEL